MPRAQHTQTFVDLANTEFFKALCEPIRIELLAVLIQQGRADISTLAEHFTQDRSVISRHLAQLEASGIVRASRDGRHKFYEIDGQYVLQTLELLTTRLRSLIAQCGC